MFLSLPLNKEPANENSANEISNQGLAAPKADSATKPAAAIVPN
jgi:hypothetical protein